MNFFDNSDIEIPCLHCGKKTKKRVGSAKNDKTFTCPNCGEVSTVDPTQLRDNVKSADKALADFKRAIGKLGK
jgi:uncharacterized Zn finger protein